MVDETNTQINAEQQPKLNKKKKKEINKETNVDDDEKSGASA